MITMGKDDTNTVHDIVPATDVLQRQNGEMNTVCSTDGTVSSNEKEEDESVDDIVPPTLPHISPPPNGYVWESYQPPASGEQQQIQRALAKNDFPYYMEDGIEHWCLWKLGGGDVNDVDIKWAKEELGQRNDDILEMLHWINPEHLKSLPDIDHAHIVCLKKTM